MLVYFDPHVLNINFPFLRLEVVSPSLSFVLLHITKDGKELLTFKDQQLNLDMNHNSLPYVRKALVKIC